MTVIFCADAASQVEKGKLHGCIDVGLSVMAIKKKAKCIDLDAEENIYHLKVNQQANKYNNSPRRTAWFPFFFFLLDSLTVTRFNEFIVLVVRGNVG